MECKCQPFKPNRECEVHPSRLGPIIDRDPGDEADALDVDRYIEQLHGLPTIEEPTR